MNSSESGIVFAKLADQNLSNEILSIIKLNMDCSNSFHTKMSIDLYSDIVKQTQLLINNQNYTVKIATQCEHKIKEYIREDKFFIQTNLYLRATRPYVVKETESIGWHRESFYGPNLQRSINIRTPIWGVNSESTLRFKPNSHLIPDEDIITRQVPDRATTKGSTGNIIGFLYAPKPIVQRVDLTSSQPLNVPEFHSAIFPGNLIHESGVNNSLNIRFSVDFRILPFSAYKTNEAKQMHISSGRPYFELF